MAFNFPDTPALLEAYLGYVWDGEKWVLPASVAEIEIEFVELFGVAHPDQLMVLRLV